uniref:Prolyl endopeptidase n=1 Tax=Ditylenchus dipsaci TaxID=166011 RepID=A0A915DZD7_9BILA
MLMAVASQQRPDLFAAVICWAGTYDMIHFLEKVYCYEESRVEYGDITDKEQFEHILRYSPLHNIPETLVKNPSMLILSGLMDPTVDPRHYSARFLASMHMKMQHMKADSLPLILGRFFEKDAHKLLFNTKSRLIFSFLHAILKFEIYDAE